MGFLRSLGGVLGAAISGSVMTAGLAASAMPQSKTIDLADLASMPADTRTLIVESYRHAIGASTLACATVMLVAFVLVLGLRGVRLDDRP
jgi:hypothetical protein